MTVDSIASNILSLMKRHKKNDGILWADEMISYMLSIDLDSVRSALERLESGGLVMSTETDYDGHTCKEYDIVIK